MANRLRDAWDALRGQNKEYVYEDQKDIGGGGIASQVLATGSGYTSYSARTVLNVTTIGYLNNITVYRGVAILAQAIAALEWQVYAKYGKKQQVDNHLLQALMEQPNLKRGRANFMEQLVSYFLIGGTNYLWSVQNNPSSVPLGLYNLRPDLVQAEVNSQGDIYNYRYGGKDYDPRYMHPIRFFHPLNENMGLSPLQVAASVIERQNAGEEWNFNLMANSARPSGAFVANTDLPPLNRGKMIQEIKKKYGGGRMTAGVPLLLENGLTYIQLALSPIDADWFNSDASAGRKILAAIGVDSLLVNDKEFSTYNNVSEAKLAMWELTGLGLISRLEDELNMWLPKLYQDDVELRVDRRPIELLKQNRAGDAAVVTSLWAGGLMSFNSAALELAQNVIDDADDFYKFGSATAPQYVRKSGISAWLDAQEKQALAPPPPLIETPAIGGKPSSGNPQIPAPKGHVTVTDVTHDKSLIDVTDPGFDLALGMQAVWEGKFNPYQ